MRFRIENVENKSADWKVVTAKEAVEGGQTIYNASMNRTSKSGEVFPNFDGIVAGAEIEADHWRSPAGKDYLFAPKVRKPSNGAFKAAQIEKAVERKENFIEKQIDRKEEAIRLAGAMRDGTLIALASLKDQPFPTDEEFKAEWLKWVKWLMAQAEQPFL